MSKMDKEEFRAEVRAWLDDNFPKALANKSRVLGAEGGAPLSTDEKAWKKAMGAKGWGTPTWPKEYGGGGLSRGQSHIINQELARIGATNPIGGMGVMMLGPTLLEYATEEQKQLYIPPICRGEIQWCQGFSEPGAGSDLASLRTKCEDKGDHFLLNGQKTWTSGGQWADWCFAIVRTDTSRKHAGISFVLLDMKTAGVEVRPIDLISGSSTFCETFFTDVKVPKDQLIGKLNDGWTVAKRLLQHERTNLSGGTRLTRSGPSLIDMAKENVGVDENGKIADSQLRSKIIDHQIRSKSFQQTAMRIMVEAKAGGPATVSSILKNVGAKLAQGQAEMTIEMKGLQGLGWEGEGFEPAELAQTRGWLWGKAMSVYGGSSEIQNNIIAKRILGMLDHQ